MRNKNKREDVELINFVEIGAFIQVYFGKSHKFCSLLTFSASWGGSANIWQTMSDNDHKLSARE